MSRDKYHDFAHLASENREGEDYAIILFHRSSGVTVVAPHGGGIEPGTSELAQAFAGEDHSLYLFEGLRLSTNQDLHISSTCFDEPHCLKMISQSLRVLTVHGCRGSRPIVYAGGQDILLRERLVAAFTGLGLHAGLHDGEISGQRHANICNQGLNHRGVQLEFSYGLRQLLFEDVEARQGRRQALPLLSSVAVAVRQALLDVPVGM